MKRKPWIYNGKEHWHTQDLIKTIVEDIETIDEADEFFNAYLEVCTQAENQLGYMAYLIGRKYGKDYKEDVLDLFMVEERPTFIDHTFNGSSLGIRID